MGRIKAAKTRLIRIWCFGKLTIFLFYPSTTFRQVQEVGELVQENPPTFWESSEISNLRAGSLSLKDDLRKCVVCTMAWWWKRVNQAACLQVSTLCLQMPSLAVFLSHPSLFVTSFLKNVTFWPAGTKLFETGRNVTIRLVKHSYFLPSQICHLSWKREVGRPFGLRPTLSVFQCVECVVVCYIVNISRAAATAFDQISSRGSIQCVCCSVL